MTTGRSDIETGISAEKALGGAWGGPLSTRFPAPPSLRAVGAFLARELASQGGRWKLWAPVAFGSGSAIYFLLLREPLIWVAGIALACAAVMLAAGRRLRRPAAAAILMLAACGLAGFGLAKIRSDRVKAPVAAAEAPPQRIEGWVEDVASPGQGGPRLLVAPARIGDWPAWATPIRIRVTLREGQPIPSPGATVSLLAMVNPPPPPASPGAYDFARDAFFDSVGGVGFALGPTESWRTELRPPWRLRLTMRINETRWAMTRRIVEVLGPETGGLAAAMTTGQTVFVPPAQVDDLRAAGLAHIISISGLHMAIVGGFTFAGLRLAIAAWPWLALRINGKKCAAAAALIAVQGYLLLSGAPPAAERAAVTAAVAFGAILVDRRAISFHALSLAAFVVLFLQPEAVTQPGFQMSFAATAALVAVAELWPRPVREINTPWPIRLVQRAWSWVLIGTAISLAAGAATAPFAVQDFNRISTWGAVANLLVEPLSTFLMMPGLALGALLMPFGLESAPLHVAGFSIGLMNRIAAAVASAPASQLIVASGPNWCLPMSFIGLLWVCLWRGWLRALGVPLALAVWWAPKPAVPEVWVGNDGAAAAVRHGPDAVLFRPDVKRFGAELWARRRGLTPLETTAERDMLFDCDDWSCAPKRSAPVRVAAAWNLKRPLKSGRLEALCSTAELVILRNDVPRDACSAPVVLTGADFERGGAAELYREAAGWRVVWAQDQRGRRPWTWGPDPR